VAAMDPVAAKHLAARLSNKRESLAHIERELANATAFCERARAKIEVVKSDIAELESVLQPAPEFAEI